MAAITPDLPKVEAAIVALTNDFRRESKLGALQPSPALAAAAKAFAAYLARTKAFSHTADGQTFAERARKSGYTPCQIAENLALHRHAAGFETNDLARRTVEGWKASPGHRQNLESPHMTEIGVGVAEGPDRTYLSVQLLGRPDSQRYQFRIDNATPATVTFRISDKPEKLAPHVSVRFSRCLPATLVFDSLDPPKRFQPRDGDRFAVTGTAADIRIEIQPAR
jgi:hypothetical protein